MSFVQEKRVDLGQLINGSFRTLGLIKRELVVYFAVFAALAFVAQLNSAIDGVLTIISLIAYFLGQYVLYYAILKKTGLLQDDRKRVLGFIVMALVLGFPIMIGLNFFIFPGIILGARWIMAPTYLVARDRNIFEAIGESWRASEFNTVQLSFAYLIFWIIWVLSFLLIGGLDGAIMPSGVESMSPFGWLAIHVLPVLMMGLSISAYRQLSNDTGGLRQVFT